MKLLKFTVAMLVMLTTLGFTACGDDEEDPEKVMDELIKQVELEEALVGTWKSVSYTSTENGEEYYAASDAKNYILITFTEATVTIKTYINGEEDVEERETSTYTVKGNKIIDDDGEEMTFEIKGDTLTLTSLDNGEKNIIVLKRQ
jgi:hypothetical protein